MYCVCIIYSHLYFYNLHPSTPFIIFKKHNFISPFLGIFFCIIKIEDLETNVVVFVNPNILSIKNKTSKIWLKREGRKDWEVGLRYGVIWIIWLHWNRLIFFTYIIPLYIYLAWRPSITITTKISYFKKYKLFIISNMIIISCNKYQLSLCQWFMILK